MIATDVAARGLDINDVQYVINYDFPLDIENYVHRIGRTARVDKKGTSVTYITPDEATHAHKLVKILRETNQEVTEDLLNLVKFGQRVKSEGKQQKKKVKRNRYGQTDYSGVKRYRGLSDEDYGFDRKSNFNRRNRFNDDGYGGDNRRSRRQSDYDDDDDDWHRGDTRKSQRRSDYDDWDRKHLGPNKDFD